MKQFLIFVSAVIFLLMVVGVLFRSSDVFFIKYGVNMAFAILTFLWVPLFLFYAYDRRQRRREQEDEEEQ